MLQKGMRTIPKEGKTNLKLPDLKTYSDSGIHQQDHAFP